MPCPLPRRIERVRVSISSPLMQPSPNGRRVGIRIVTFEACSGFTRVTAHRIAQPPKATFVARLQPSQLPNQAARQLPDQSTTIRVEPSSTDDSRLRGALPRTDIGRRRAEQPRFAFVEYLRQTTAAFACPKDPLAGICLPSPDLAHSVEERCARWLLIQPRRRDHDTQPHCPAAHRQAPA